VPQDSREAQQGNAVFKLLTKLLAGTTTGKTYRTEFVGFAEEVVLGVRK
jgi:hypothetical protein